MTQISALPVLSVQIAFNPSNITSLTQNWTDVTPYVRAYDVQAGRQHYLDRVQSTQLTLTVNNRSGFFLNGGATGNNTGYVVQPRCPIKITATYSGTTYNVFYGLIDAITESVQDQVNADLTITASDFLKYLSLKYLATSTFYPSYAKVGSTQNYYRLGGSAPVVVTAASCNGTTATYTANNSFTAGQIVSVFGLVQSDGVTPSTLNTQRATIASATATQFTITTATAATNNYNQSGVAYIAQYADLVGSANSNLWNQVAFPPNGAMAYDPQNCTDLANGGTSPSGYIYINRNLNQTGTSYGIDFWVLGNGLNSISGGTTTVLAGNYDALPTPNQTVQLQVDTQGYLQLYYRTNTPSVVQTTYVLDGSGNKIQVADGYWHHVGLHVISGTCYVYADGNFTALGVSLLTPLTGGYFLGSNGGVAVSAAGLFQDVCVVNNTITQNDVKNRFRAGSLLQRGQPVTPEAVYSGDRIAETLVLAGFGTISAGTLSGLSTIYNINGSAYSTPYNSANGFINVEPYYWDSPVYNSTALDIISQVTDTDLGAFYQRRDGTFRYNDQAFYGTWTWSSSTSTGSWTPNTYTPTGSLVWTDDDSSNYSYEAASLQVLRDDADLWTVVRVTPQSGTEQVYDSGNESRWGYSTLAKSGTVHPNLTLALSTATYLGTIYRSPLPRVSNVELRNTSHNGGALPAILGTQLGDVVLFKRSAPNSSTSGTYPSQKGQIDQNMVVESISQSFQAEPGTYIATFVLDPYPVRS